jgi:hypothetical protein
VNHLVKIPTDRVANISEDWKSGEFTARIRKCPSTQCARFYAEKMGRPSLAPGRYFRLLLSGHSEGIDSECGIAWRAADSLALRSFLGVD